MANLQVKSIDANLYEILGKKAISENRSISQEVVYILKQYLSTPAKANNAVDSFLELSGTWSDDRSADVITEELRDFRKNRSETNNVFF